MVKIKRVVIPTDFSDGARNALNYAISFCQEFDAELHLLNVIHDLSLEVPDFGMGLAFPAYVENLPQKQQDLEEETLKALAGLVDPEWQKDRVVSLVTRQGVPYVEIVRYVRDLPADLVVMGTHGRSGIAHTLLGSVAERVVRKCPCPVLTVGEKGFQFEHP